MVSNMVKEIYDILELTYGMPRISLEHLLTLKSSRGVVISPDSGEGDIAKIFGNLLPLNFVGVPELANGSVAPIQVNFHL